MKLPFINKRKVVQILNQAMFEEHQDNQFEEHQIQRSYSAGYIDGIGFALSVISEKPQNDGAWSYPISLSFYEEEDESCTIYAKQQQVEQMRERMFDLQNKNKYAFFGEEAD